MTRRRWLFILLGIAVSVAFLLLSFRQLSWAELRREAGRVNPLVFLLGPLLRLTNLAIASLRSRILFRPLRHISFWRQFKSVLLAFAVNNVIPLRAGEFARIGYLARYGELPASTVLAVIAVERLLDVLVLVAIVVTTLPAVAIDLPAAVTSTSLAVGIALAVGGVLFVSRRPDLFVVICRWCAGWFGSWMRGFVEARARRFAEGLSALKSLAAVFGVMLTTAMFWLMAVGGISLWIWAFGFDLQWYAPVVVLAFVSFGLAVPSTPGHVGTYHFFTIEALLTLGVSRAAAGSYAILAHAMAVLPLTLLAVPLLFRDYSSSRQAARVTADGGPS